MDADSTAALGLQAGAAWPSAAGGEVPCGGARGNGGGEGSVRPTCAHLIRRRMDDLDARAIDSPPMRPCLPGARQLLLLRRLLAVASGGLRGRGMHVAQTLPFPACMCCQVEAGPQAHLRGTRLSHEPEQRPSKGARAADQHRWRRRGQRSCAQCKTRSQLGEAWQLCVSGRVPQPGTQVRASTLCAFPRSGHLKRTWG